MYKEVLQNMDNIAIWPVMSFVIFFAFFIGLLWYVFSVDKKFINHMSNMPMADDAQLQSSSETQNKKL